MHLKVFLYHILSFLQFESWFILVPDHISLNFCSIWRCCYVPQSQTCGTNSWNCNRSCCWACDSVFHILLMVEEGSTGSHENFHRLAKETTNIIPSLGSACCIICVLNETLNNASAPFGNIDNIVLKLVLWYLAIKRQLWTRITMWSNLWLEMQSRKFNHVHT